VLIGAAAPLLKECELRIAGQGPPGYVEKLKKRAASLDVQFVGFVKAEAFLAEVDVLVIPSLWNEPSGMVIIEAFAQGVPVIGSNRGGIPECIEENKTGFLFSPERPESLTAALERFISDRDLLARMQVDALSKSYDLLPSRMIDGYLAVYEKALGDTPHREEQSSPDALLQRGQRGHCDTGDINL